MKEIEIKGTIYKIKEVLTVKTRMEYLKVIGTLQTQISEIAKKNGYQPKDLPTIFEKVITQDQAVIFELGISLDVILGFEFSLFKVLYTGFVIEPKLSEAEMENLDNETYQKIRDILNEMIQEYLSVESDFELKKKHGNV